MKSRWAPKWRFGLSASWAWVHLETNSQLSRRSACSYRVDSLRLADADDFLRRRAGGASGDGRPSAGLGYPHDCAASAGWELGAKDRLDRPDDWRAAGRGDSLYGRAA